MGMVDKGLGVGHKADRGREGKESIGIGNDDEFGNFGLGVKQKQVQCINTVAGEMVMGHHNHHHRPFLSSEYGNDADGPTIGISSSMTHEIDAFTTDTSIGGSGGGAAVRALQHFDISSASTTTTNSTAFNSPDEGMEASMGYPLTNAQWKELERQAMIYKYMVASLPVPPHLLLPITRNISEPHLPSSSPLSREGLNLRLSSKDEEPGRCRRTDGKKWRCSKEVAPDHKYCDRHLHRGRPRSRKPVEIHSHSHSYIKRSRHQAFSSTTSFSSSPLSLPLPPNPATTTVSNKHNASHPPFLECSPATLHHYNSTSTPLFLYNSCSLNDPTLQTSSSLLSRREATARGLECVMKDEAAHVAPTDEQRQLLMQSKIGLPCPEKSSCNCSPDASIFTHHYKTELLNVVDSCSSNYSNGENKRSSSNCGCMLLRPESDVVNFETQMAPKDYFTDAWSKTVIEENMVNSGSRKSSVSSTDHLSPSSLTLSISMATHHNNSSMAMDDEMKMGHIYMGLGLIQSQETNHNDTKYDYGGDSETETKQPFATLGGGGGPLAEALRPSAISTTITSNAVP